MQRTQPQPGDQVGPVSFTGHGVSVFQARAIASGLKMFAATGMKPNSRWTPTAMMKTARAIVPTEVGKRIKARDYLAMSRALTAWADEQTSAIHEANREATD